MSLSLPIGDAETKASSPRSTIILMSRRAPVGQGN